MVHKCKRGKYIDGGGCWQQQGIGECEGEPTETKGRKASCDCKKVELEGWELVKVVLGGVVQAHCTYKSRNKG